MWVVGTVTFSAKRSKHMQWGMQCTVGTQYALGVSAKRSTHTVELVNMEGGDHYL